jgi:hypothetical protein
MENKQVTQENRRSVWLLGGSGSLMALGRFSGKGASAAGGLC